MIELYYWPTPNGHKITMFLEEAGLDYTIHPVNISAGDQLKPEFLRISPNNRMPTIIDPEPSDGGEPISVFESGAILVYLAEKTEKLFLADLRGRKTARVGLLASWRARRHGGAEPSLRTVRAREDPVRDGALHQGDQAALWCPRPAPRRREFIASDTYTIADIAAYPWIVPWKRQQQDLDSFPNLRRWFNAVRERPATQRAYAKGEPYASRPAVTEEGKKIRFGQTAQTT